MAAAMGRGPATFQGRCWKTRTLPPSHMYGSSLPCGFHLLQIALAILMATSKGRGVER